MPGQTWRDTGHKGLMPGVKARGERAAGEAISRYWSEVLADTSLAAE